MMAWGRYSGENVYYYNAMLGRIPPQLLARKFDLIVFHALFMSEKWTDETWARAMRAISPLRTYDAYKIAMPQDEYIHSKSVCEFIDDFAIDHLFTLAPENNLETLYGRVKKPFRTTRIFPGYLESALFRKIDNALSKGLERTIDIGYRAWGAPEWVGRHGLLKTQIADAFNASPAAQKLRLNVSTSPQDTIMGDAWYDWLAQCRYVLGVEGGSSLHDPDGRLRDITEAYKKANPDASFEQIEQACFPGLDGKLLHYAISPRHLEAAATRTGQILVRGEYNGVLHADRHYIPVEPDFSNIPEVVEKAADETLRKQMVERAYEEIVRPGLYTWRSHIGAVMDEVRPELLHASGEGFAARLDVMRWNWIHEAHNQRWLAANWPDHQPANWREKLARKLADYSSKQTEAKVERQLAEPPVWSRPVETLADWRLAWDSNERRNYISGDYGWVGFVKNIASRRELVLMLDGPVDDALDFDFFEELFAEVDAAVIITDVVQSGLLSAADSKRWEDWNASQRFVFFGPIAPRERAMMLRLTDGLIYPFKDGSQISNANDALARAAIAAAPAYSTVVPEDPEAGSYVLTLPRDELLAQLVRLFGPGAVQATA